MFRLMAGELKRSLEHKFLSPAAKFKDINDNSRFQAYLQKWIAKYPGETFSLRLLELLSQVSRNKQLAIQLGTQDHFADKIVIHCHNNEIYVSHCNFISGQAKEIARSLQHTFPDTVKRVEISKRSHLSRIVFDKTQFLHVIVPCVFNPANIPVKIKNDKEIKITPFEQYKPVALRGR